MNKSNRLTINEVASMGGKASHKKNPRTKQFFSEIGKKGAANRWGHKIKPHGTSIQDL
jgi:general stress protein YciG